MEFGAFSDQHSLFRVEFEQATFLIPSSILLYFNPLTYTHV